MKQLKVNAVVYEMMMAMSGKKSPGDIEKWLEKTIKAMYIK